MIIIALYLTDTTNSNITTSINSLKSSTIPMTSKKLRITIKFKIKYFLHHQQKKQTKKEKTL